MNVGLRGAITNMHVLIHDIVSHFVTFNVKCTNCNCKTPNVCHLIQLGSRCQYFRDCLLLNPCNPPFVGITSKLLLHHASSWSLFRQLTYSAVYMRLRHDLENINWISQPIPSYPDHHAIIWNSGYSGLGFWGVCSNFFTCNFSLDAD